MVLLITNHRVSAELLSSLKFKKNTKNLTRG